MQQLPSDRSKVSGNICPIPPRKKSNTGDSTVYPVDISNLIDEYKKLQDRLRAIRGNLYKQGVDPENFK